MVKSRNQDLELIAPGVWRRKQARERGERARTTTGREEVRLRFLARSASGAIDHLQTVIHHSRQGAFTCGRDPIREALAFRESGGPRVVGLPDVDHAMARRKPLGRQGADLTVRSQRDQIDEEDRHESTE